MSSSWIRALAALCLVHLIIFTDGGDDSGTYWLVDIGKHSVESIGQAYPDVKEADVGPVSVVDWKAAAVAFVQKYNPAN